MKHIKTLITRNLKESVKKGGCGECQTSCQSACKTSCTVGNQSCEKMKSLAAMSVDLRQAAILSRCLPFVERKYSGDTSVQK